MNTAVFEFYQMHRDEGALGGPSSDQEPLNIHFGFLDIPLHDVMAHGIHFGENGQLHPDHLEDDDDGDLLLPYPHDPYVDFIAIRPRRKYIMGSHFLHNDAYEPWPQRMFGGDNDGGEDVPPPEPRCDWPYIVQPWLVQEKVAVDHRIHRGKRFQKRGEDRRGHN